MLRAVAACLAIAGFLAGLSEARAQAPAWPTLPGTPEITIIEDRVDRVEIVPGPGEVVVVEEWVVVRPANCGEFHYWDGERCADARVDPPYVGPRW